MECGRVKLPGGPIKGWGEGRHVTQPVCSCPLWRLLECEKNCQLTHSYLPWILHKLLGSLTERDISTFPVLTTLSFTSGSITYSSTAGDRESYSFITKLATRRIECSVAISSRNLQAKQKPQALTFTKMGAEQPWSSTGLQYHISWENWISILGRSSLGTSSRGSEPR